MRERDIPDHPFRPWDDDDEEKINISDKTIHGLLGTCVCQECGGLLVPFPDSGNSYVCHKCKTIVKKNN